MLDRKVGIFLSTAALALAAMACGKKEDTKTSGGGGVVKTDFKASRISQTAFTQASFALAKAKGTPLNLADARGTSQGTQLESLKYLVSSVSFCGKLANAGTSTNCETPPWTIYSNEAAQNYDEFLPANAATTDEGYVDFMDKESVKTLGSTSEYTDSNIGSYEAVSVGWFRPFKVKASITLSNGTTVYTKSSNQFESNNKSGLDVTYQTTVSNVTTGPAEEGVFFLPNGGTFFKLQTPFELTQADVDNKATFNVVFAFDPDNQISANAFDPSLWTPDMNWRTGMVDPVLGYRIDAPFLQVAPVVARPGETVMREVYLLRSADNLHDVRLSIYYIKEDSTKAARAVTITNILNGNAYTPMVWHQANTVTADADGKLTIKDWMGLPMVEGLERFKSEVGTVTHQKCAHGTAPVTDIRVCANGVTTLNYSVAFVGEGSLETDITASYVPPKVDETGTVITTP